MSGANFSGQASEIQGGYGNELKIVAYVRSRNLMGVRMCGLDNSAGFGRPLPETPRTV
jgi:hypothetical protein